MPQSTSVQPQHGFRRSGVPCSTATSAADGAFVYAVRSTGVYCKPSCPSRRPRRDRVEFFAKRRRCRARAGYRPCRRCRPEQGAGRRSVDRQKYVAPCVYLANVEGHLSLARLAARIGGQPLSLSNAASSASSASLLASTPMRCRLQRLKRGLRSGFACGTAAMVDAGYGSSSRFYERAAAKLAMAAGSVSTGRGRHAHVLCDRRLSTRPPAGGRDRTRRLSGVSMGSSDGDLVSAPEGGVSGRRGSPHQHRASRAGRGRSSATSRGGGPRLRSLPLDVQATAFQWQVVDGARGDSVRRDANLSAGCRLDWTAVVGFARLHTPALPTRSRWPFHVTGWSGPAAAWADTAGALRERRPLLAAEHRMKD